LLLCVVYIES